MVEAMACGTPTIAFRCGSVPEVLKDGVSGYIVNSEEEAVRALARVDMLDRAKVRREFERRFVDTLMAQNYLRVYEQLLSASDDSRTSQEELQPTAVV
jgi:glycosyltransferase involved in cell wall biosynthesis